MSGDAIIVGAGIGGLGAGRALRDDGWRVTIFERASGIPRTGTALGMWPEAMAALDRLGVGDRVRDQGILQQGAAFLRPDGVEFARINSRDPAYLISRPALHALLYQDALEDCVVWDTTIDDGTALPEADLIIGADGINSRIRNVVASRILAPRPLGTVAFRGVVPGTVERVTETWGEGRLFGITPQDSQTINWFACVREDLLSEHGSTLNDAELLATMFASWHPAVAEVVKTIDPTQIDRRVLYDSAPLDSIVRDHTVVIGDAAHAMAPNAGRGACEALVDATKLADALHTSSALDEGLRAFDRSRRRAGWRTVRVSRFLNRLSTARHSTAVRRRTMSALARLT